MKRRQDFTASRSPKIQRGCGGSVFSGWGSGMGAWRGWRWPTCTSELQKVYLAPQPRPDLCLTRRCLLLSHDPGEVTAHQPDQTGGVEPGQVIGCPLCEDGRALAELCYHVADPVYGLPGVAGVGGLERRSEVAQDARQVSVHGLFTVVCLPFLHWLVLPVFDTGVKFSCYGVAMNDTKINWTDYTWNVFSGCEPVSEGCKFCYAETLAEQKRGTRAFPNGFDLTLRMHKLNEPYRLKKPSLVFVNSMSDLFWDAVGDDIRDQIVDVIESTPHEYQVLTKRPHEMLRYSRRRKLPPNFWAGVTLESARHADRLDLLRSVEVEVRFVSAEPLLGDISGCDFSGIHWLIGGGESGRHLTAQDAVARRRGMVERGPSRGPRWVPRADRYHWAQDLRDACQRQGVAFWWKQWGGPKPHSAGREIDGRTWDELPRTPVSRQVAMLA